MANYWLIKSEPDVYSIDALKRDGKTWWEDVRNYQARNFMMNEMKPGDTALFYHSNAEPSGIAGLARISHAARPDKNQFDKKKETYDPKATLEKPIWFCVEVEFVEKFKKLIALNQLKSQKALADLMLFKQSRLSVVPVSEKQFQKIMELV